MFLFPIAALIELYKIFKAQRAIQVAVAFGTRISGIVCYLGIGLGLSFATWLICKCVAVKRRVNTPRSNPTGVNTASDDSGGADNAHEPHEPDTLTGAAIVNPQGNAMGNDKSRYPPPVEYNEAQRIRNLKRGPNISLMNLTRPRLYGGDETKRAISLHDGLHRSTAAGTPQTVLPSPLETPSLSEQTPLSELREVAEPVASQTAASSPSVSQQQSPPVNSLQETPAADDTPVTQAVSEDTDGSGTPPKRPKLENADISEIVEPPASCGDTNTANPLSMAIRSPVQLTSTDSLTAIQLDVGEDYVVVGLPVENASSNEDPLEITQRGGSPATSAADIVVNTLNELAENTIISETTLLERSTSERSVSENHSPRLAEVVNFGEHESIPAGGQFSGLQSLTSVDSGNLEEGVTPNSIKEECLLEHLTLTLETGSTESVSTSESLTPTQDWELSESGLGSMLPTPLTSVHGDTQGVGSMLPTPVTGFHGDTPPEVKSEEDSVSTTGREKNVIAASQADDVTINSGLQSVKLAENPPSSGETGEEKSMTDSGYIGGGDRRNIQTPSTDSRGGSGEECTESEESILSDSLDRDPHLNISSEREDAKDAPTASTGDNCDQDSTHSSISSKSPHILTEFAGSVSAEEDAVPEVSSQALANQAQQIGSSNIVNSFSFDSSLLRSAEVRRRSFRESGGSSTHSSPSTTPRLNRSASQSSSSLSMEISVDPNVMGEALVKCCNLIEKEVVEIVKNLVEDENTIHRLMKEDTGEVFPNADIAKKLSNIVANSPDFGLSTETISRGFELNAQNYISTTGRSIINSPKRMSSLPPTPESSSDHSLHSNTNSLTTKSSSMHDILTHSPHEEGHGSRETICSARKDLTNGIADSDDLSMIGSLDVESRFAGTAGNGYLDLTLLESGHTVTGRNPSVFDIRHYAAQEWKSSTPTAQTIRKGYQTLVEEYGYRSIIRIRGDNYCALRATYCSAVLNGLPVLPVDMVVDLALKRLTALDSTEPTILHSWRFASALQIAAPGENYETLRDWLNYFRSKTKGLYKMKMGEERQNGLFQFLNSGSENELYILESLKLIMFLSAYDLYKANLAGKDVPVFVWLLFARDTSENPAKFLTNHLNKVGDSAGLEQVEMFLLGHSLGVTLQTFRLYQFGNDDFLAYYPEDDNTKPLIPIIAEDDRHYNTVIRRC